MRLYKIKKLTIAAVLLLAFCGSSALAADIPQSVAEDNLYICPRPVSGSVAGYTHDARFDDAVISEGIDISKWQTSVDWGAVKSSGVDFVMLRAGYRGTAEGNIYKDERFDKHFPGAEAADLDIGVYFYSQAITKAEAVDEAEFLLKVIDGCSLELPVVFDYEYAGSGGNSGRLYKAQLTNDQRTEICRAFCERIEKAGYTAMIYANKWMLEKQLDAASLAEDYPIWLANYTSKTSYAGSYSYWQYTASGEVSGAPGAIDCNYRYIMPIGTVTGLTITQNGRLNWEKVAGAYGYQIFRRSEGESEYKHIATVRGAGTVSYSDTEKGSYKVRAIELSAGNIICGQFSNEAAAAADVLDAPELEAENADVKTIILDWSEVEGAAGYVLMRKQMGADSWTNIKNTLSTTEYTDAGLMPGTYYHYAVRAVSKEAKSAYTIITVCARPDTPEGLKAESGSDGIRLSWSPVSKITQYRVVRSEGNGFYGVKLTAGTSFTDHLAQSGKSYIYKVQAYRTIDGKNIFGNFSEPVSL